MKQILLTLFLFTGVAASAQETASAPIPLKDQKPYYERAFATPLKGSEAFYAAKLFFAEYFKRSTPQTIIEDKDAGRLTVKTCLFYHFMDNPETYRGRLLSLSDITFRHDSCIVHLYDWQVQRSGTKTRWIATANGFIPDGVPVWNDQNEQCLIADATDGRRRAKLELAALDSEVVKMLDAFQKKVGTK